MSETHATEEIATPATGELHTAEEIGHCLKVSPHTVKTWARDGVIPSIWLSPTCRRFSLSAVLVALRGRGENSK